MSRLLAISLIIALGGLSGSLASELPDRLAQTPSAQTSAAGYDDYLSRAAASVQQKSHAKALADLTQAIALAPKRPTAYFERGKIHYSKDDFEKASKDFYAAAALAPDNYDYRLNYALALNAKGDFERALPEFDQLVQADPNNAVAADGRGMVKFNTGDLGGALIDFNQASFLDPDNTKYSDHAYAVRASQQAAVVSAIERYKSTYSAALNDLQRDAIEDQRGKELCRIMPTKSVSGWAGRLTRLNTSFLDNVHISIDFGNGYIVENNTVLCIKCLIQKYGSTWENLLSHQVGDTVYFSGQFETVSKDKCIRANNIMQGSRMNSPSFFMTFDSIR